MSIKSNNKYIEELTVEQLFNNGQYSIPIYQRNYAWGEPEVVQLLQDVMDVSTQHQEGSYYIGSLVVDRRQNGEFEIIDGQQRHTTLCVLLSVLKNEYNQHIQSIRQINLSFDSRPKSDRTLNKLFSAQSKVDESLEECSIRAAYEVSKRYLAKYKSSEIDQFSQYLMGHVKILRVIVPINTDLNHYFEIMNNRGEQLEKHEVLKARMMKLLTNDAERNCFAKVWDACADMNRYVQLGFEANIRPKVFGNDWNTPPQLFTELSNILSTIGSNDQSRSLASIIAKPSFNNTEDASLGEVVNGNFSSVINFSNFLLHVLRVFKQEDIPLDDKRLLDIFAKSTIDPKKFIIDMLKCRMLFDAYIIKRENEEDWSLKSLRLYERNDARAKQSFGYVKSVDDEQQNQQLMMILSMFHVSFPALVYKHWLNAALQYLHKATKSNGISISADKYIEYLESLSKKFFYGRFGANNGDEIEPLDYFDLIYKNPVLPSEINLTYLNQGTNVQNFIFNRLDYNLWKRLKDGEIFSEVDMSYIKNRFNGFYFTFRTSVEHYYPQNPIIGRPLEKSENLSSGVDSFGNLCLISQSKNSKLSNHLPKAKKDYYENSATVESLKQVFMMSYSSWGPDNPETIYEHEKMMIEVLLG